MSCSVTTPPLSGTLPPLSDAEWQRLYELYRTIPQYQLVNQGFGLDGFKAIFWLEYLHRLWGRLIGLAFALPLALFWLRDVWVTSTQVQPIPYSDFVQHLKAGRLESMAIGSQFIEGKLKAPMADGRTRIVTTRVAPDLARELSAYDVRFEGVVENTLLRDLLSWVVPALLLLAVWSFMARRMASQGGLGGMLSVGTTMPDLLMPGFASMVHGRLAEVDDTIAPMEILSASGICASADCRMISRSFELLQRPRSGGGYNNLLAQISVYDWCGQRLVLLPRLH